MQLLWISGPLGRVRPIQFTVRRLVILAGAVLALIFALITIMNVAGARLIFNSNPGLVQKLGGLITAAEQEERESVFRAEIAQIRAALQSTERELQKAEEFKTRLYALLNRNPKGDLSRNSSATSMSGASDSKILGRGGPFIPGDPRPTLQVHELEHQGLGAADHASTIVVLNPEVRRLSARADQMRSTADKLSKEWSQNFESLIAMPLASPVDFHIGDIDLSSGFGFRRDPFNGQRAFHSGLDFSAPPGTPVYATADGVVIEVSNSPGYGRTVIIEHPSGFKTLYAHLSSIRVKQGEHVKRHTPIGGIGSTGRSTGSHLHYEVIDKTKAPLDPKFFLSAVAR